MNTPLGKLEPGAVGFIKSVAASGECSPDLARRFLEMGILEGARVEVLHQAPFGGDPLAIRVRGSIIALRRSEANHVEVAIERDVENGGEGRV
jgi:ferrous iron transport protein A